MASGGPPRGPPWAHPFGAPQGQPSLEEMLAFQQMMTQSMGFGMLRDIENLEMII